MRPQLIAFDLDDTLWPNREVMQAAEAAQYQALCERVPALSDHLSQAEMSAPRLALLEADPSYYRRISDLRRESIVQLLQPWIESETERRQLADQVFEQFWQARQAVTPFADTQMALERLSQHFPLAAWSNGNADLATIGLAHHFSHITRAELLGAAKPDPEFFRRALAVHRLPPEAVLYVGDHLQHDIESAAACGLMTAWIYRDADASAPHQATWACEDLHQLAEQLLNHA